MKVREGVQIGSKWRNETETKHREASNSSKSHGGDEGWPTYWDGSKNRTVIQNDLGHLETMKLVMRRRRLEVMVYLIHKGAHCSSAWKVAAKFLSSQTSLLTLNSNRPDRPFISQQTTRQRCPRWDNQNRPLWGLLFFLICYPLTRAK